MNNFNEKYREKQINQLRYIKKEEEFTKFFPAVKK